MAKRAGRGATRLGIAAFLMCALAWAAPAADAQMRGGMRGGGPRGGGTGGSPSGGEGSPPGEDVSPEVMGAFFPQRADLGHMKARGFMETGLLPLYPKGARCYEVNSPFASPYRGDGSRRSSRFFWGLHGGMDIPAPGGTPILAVAAGRVVHKSPGAQDGIGGIGVVLQHAPEDTGLPLWTYTEYKHLREMPALEIGRRVRMGEVIAHVGNTGTTGGHYGPMGHYHLHLTAWAAPGPEFRAARFFIPAGGEWLDPLALYRRAPLKSAEISGLPGDQKRVPIPYATAGGKIVPEGTKVVWPLACEGR